MTNKNTISRALLGISLGAAILGGCASTRPPTETMESSAASIAGAKQAGAEDVPSAALYLQLANESSERAKVLIASGGHDNMKKASNLLMRATADGDLAIALAGDDKDRIAAEAAVAQIHTYELQIQ
jgi:alpha/beta superfamily hydrolase